MSSAEERSNLIAAGNEETIKEEMELVRHLQKEAFQLANYYFVFQGVIFTAFYNTPSKLKCRYHWIPFTLSFLAGFLNLCALSTIALKYKRTLDAIDRHVMGEPPEFDNDPLLAPTGTEMNVINDPSRATRNENTSEPIAVKSERHWRMTYVIFCMALFLGFFIVTLIGSWKLTCNVPPTPTAATPPV